MTLPLPGGPVAEGGHPGHGHRVRGACVMVDRCGIETALLADVIAAGDAKLASQLAETDRTPCLPVLDRAGAQALIGFKGRRVLG